MSELDRLLHVAVALHDKGRFAEALAMYDDLVGRWPNLAFVWNNRGNTLLELSRYDEAAESYHQALVRAPQLHDCRVALATCLQAMGRVDEALHAVEQVLLSAPDHAEAHWNRALLLLLLGRYPEGFREYEWRWKKRRFTSPLREFRQPGWDGESLRGKSILIHAEQGFGDTIQFCRYLPLLVEQGAHVLFECHPPLAGLMRSLGDGIDVIQMGQRLPDFDVHLPLLSLPLRIGDGTASMPSRCPYLSVAENRLPFWASVLPQTGRRKVGLCWTGKAYPDPLRSIPPEELMPLGGCRGIDLISLQIGNAAAPDNLALIDLTMLINDFADTAALIAQLDLVITIDTAVAHLACALGRETWVLLPFAPDWRWGLAGASSRWYPTARLFRQGDRRDWKDVVEQVAALL